ncbi:MFS transporter [Thermaerobacter sp. PB12/4term]|uniref:MFS transporter n=1 Tax=Thermaerobacter sp. PB12/4term TaxID=2293838 RepID=UPI000E32D0D4|nr:MFS transporter [Thermaerobacter sp. PB12/4term]QIA26898.1 MFS transporter [Thermaerobacter sp. PB12/4term]
MPAAVYVIAAVAWLYFISLDMLATGLPLALAAGGAGESWIGFLVGWMGLSAMLQRPFLAAWGDRRGHRPLLLASLAAGLAGALLFAVSRHPAAEFAARTLQGTSLAGLVVSSQALMAALAPPAQRARALALQGLADTGGVLAGTNLGEWAWHHLGRTGLFAGTAAAVAMALLLALAGSARSRPEPGNPAERRPGHRAAAAGGPPVPVAGGSGPTPSAHSPAAGGGAGPEGPPSRAAGAGQPAAHTRPASPRDARRPPAVTAAPVVATGGAATRAGRLPLPGSFLVLGTLTGVIFGAALNLTVLHAQGAGFWAGGWLALFALVAMGARYAAGSWLDRRAGGGGLDAATPSLAHRLLVLGFGLMAAGEGALAAAAPVTAVYGAAAVLAAGYGIAHTALVAAAVGGAPAHRRGLAAGWLANAIDLGVGAGLAMLGWVLETWSFSVMYGVLAGAGTLGMVTALLARSPGPRAAGRP